MTQELPPPPRIGELFYVDGRRDLLTVRQVEHLRTDGHEAEYVVRSLSGARWRLVPREIDARVRFKGEPLPADPDAPGWT